MNASTSYKLLPRSTRSAPTTTYLLLTQYVSSTTWKYCTYYVNREMYAGAMSLARNCLRHLVFRISKRIASPRSMSQSYLYHNTGIIGVVYLLLRRYSFRTCGWFIPSCFSNCVEYHFLSSCSLYGYIRVIIRMIWIKCCR